MMDRLTHLTFAGKTYVVKSLGFREEGKCFEVMFEDSNGIIGFGYAPDETIHEQHAAAVDALMQQHRRVMERRRG
jgi:hypothetical protein